MKITVKKKSLLLATLVFAVPNLYSADETPDGKELYQAYCSQCHGLEGDGFGVNSYDIDVYPRDHTDTDEMSARTDEDLFKAIKFGGKAVNKSVLMPNWEANLTDDQIELVIGHLRKLCCKGGE